MDDVQEIAGPSTELVTRQRKLRRKYQGRSRNGCTQCKRKHLKCDEQKPACRRCLLSRLECDITSIQGWRNEHRPTPSVHDEDFRPWSAQQLLSDSIQPALLWDTQRTELEREVFFRFAVSFAPVLGGWQCENFWLHTVLPAAQLHEPSFNATLAVAILYDMPLSDTLCSEGVRVSVRTQERYKRAITWYCKSMNASMKSTPQTPSTIALLIMTTILYIMVESRQGHYEAVSNLFQTAFAIIHSAKVSLQSCKDPTIFHCLTRLLGLSLHLPIDTTCIPKKYRDSVISLALQLGYVVDADPFQILHIELAGITFDMNDLMEGVTDDEDDLHIRLDCWRASLLDYRANKADCTKRLQAVRVTDHYWLYLQVSLNFWRCSFEFDNEELQKFLQGVRTFAIRDALTFRVDVTEPAEGDSNTRKEQTLPVLPIYLLEARMTAVCFGMIWYIRDETVLATTIKIFETFRSVDDRGFIDKMLTYFKELVDTPFDQATKMETELFGGRPEILSLWRIHISIHHIVREVGHLPDKLPGDIAYEARMRYRMGT